MEMMIGMAISKTPSPNKDDPKMAKVRSAEELVDEFLRLSDGTRNRLLAKYGCRPLPLPGLSNADAFIQTFIDLEERNQLAAFLQECADLRVGGNSV